MTISIWRYSHLTLAVSSFVFILLASVTGIILAFEPISEQIQPYKINGFAKVSLAETITAFKSTYPEVIELEVDVNDFVLGSVITDKGESLSGYFNPKTAQFLGNKSEPSKFFQFVTTLHRSLFLKSTGRFLVGLCSFLLFLIAISGTALIIKRQQGLRKFFSKIINENFAQYWHVVLGRWSLIPIIIITSTGVFLSLEKFDVFPKTKVSHQIDFDAIQATPILEIKDFPSFKTLKLSEVQYVEFPFSDDVEDYFTLKLKHKELLVNQFTGTVLSELENPATVFVSDLSLKLHTGKGSILWSVILAIATVNILFFIYSGFVIALKRRASRIKNTFSKNKSKYIILVGSENGSTLVFANALKDQIIASGNSVFLTELNSYTNFNEVEHVVVLTATYGEGEAPTNANNFLRVLKTIKQKQKYSFSVVGFGSLSYLNYCKYAFDVDLALQQENAKQAVPIVTVNDKSLSSFEQWVGSWSKAVDLKITIPSTSLNIKPKQLKSFKLLSSTDKNKNPDATFKLVLKPKEKHQFTSGDLLAIYPKNDYQERLYSIGKLNGKVHLSIKQHKNGIGSGFLTTLKVNDILKARIIQNKNFHFPKQANRVIMIGNGTGIIPFIGMLNQNNTAISTYLYCGLRTEESYALYQQEIEESLIKKKLTKFNLVLSQQHKKKYVQDVVLNDADFIFQTLELGGIIMVCGSLKMYQGVLQSLEQICKINNTELKSYKKLIKSDCY
tara:strand:+ start:57141 stop:59327 length:2187 start_codon:yes stop_codon:yes gene_type:complete